MSVGLATQELADIELDPRSSGGGRDSVWLGDFDADLALEFVTSGPGGLVVHEAAPSSGQPLLLSLRGVKDNRRGIGAVVELRTGPTYQRLFWAEARNCSALPTPRPSIGCASRGPTASSSTTRASIWATGA